MGVCRFCLSDVLCGGQGRQAVSAMGQGKLSFWPHFDLRVGKAGILAVKRQWLSTSATKKQVEDLASFNITF
eukprot:scaffold2331_cov126-Cylindrotheca_fusiformis.AAC.15